MLRMSLPARLLLSLIAILLLVPVAGIRLQDETRLTYLHNRHLNPPPEPARLARDPVSVYDLNATILHCLGVDHTRLTYKFTSFRDGISG